MVDEQHRRSRRDHGFTLIELLITIAISGIVAGALGNALVVVMRNYSVTYARISGANDSLTTTNLFPADIASTPPGGREADPALASGCQGPDAVGSKAILRLTWSERTGASTSYYRVNYRIVPDPSGAAQGESNLIRVSCTSTTGPQMGYGPSTERLVASGLTPFTAAYTSGPPAALSYATSLDDDKLSLTLSLDTSPVRTTTISGTRMNWGRMLPPGPVAPSVARISVVTITSSPAYTTVGATLLFSSTLTNSGTTPLSSIRLSDVAAGGPIDCPTDTLAAGTRLTCTFSHVVTQADLDIGGVTSTTTVDAMPPDGPVVTGVASAVTVPALQTLQMTTVTTTTATDYKVAGDVIEYSLVVENTGNVSLSGLVVTDPAATGPILCPASTLDPAGAPNDAVTCTYRHTVASADLVVGGAVQSAAVAQATGPMGNTAVASSNSVSVSFLASPSLSAVKRAGQSAYALAGEVIRYTITVSNTGNVTLTSIAVADPLDSDGIVSCPATALDPGASTACGADHVVTAADVLSGRIVNRATASGSPASGGGPISIVSNDETVTYVAGPSVRITTSALEPTFKNVGDILRFRYTVTNTGAVPLTGARVTDTRLGVAATPCGTGAVLPGAAIDCTRAYTITGNDLGSALVATASVTVDSPTGPAAAAANTVTVGFLADPELTVVLTGSPSPFSVLGQVITYTATITNTGNVPLTGVRVSGHTLGSTPACTPTVIAVGASTTCSSTYTTTDGDASGSVTNTVTVLGTHGAGDTSATSASLTVSSVVPCSVAGIVAAVPGSSSVPPTVRRVGSPSGNGRLKDEVTITVQTTGKCSALRIMYHPQGPATGVVDALTDATSGRWTYVIFDEKKEGASEWRSGPATIDVLAATGTAGIHTAVFQPFTVIS